MSQINSFSSTTGSVRASGADATTTASRQLANRAMADPATYGYTTGELAELLHRLTGKSFDVQTSVDSQGRPRQWIRVGDLVDALSRIPQFEGTDTKALANQIIGSNGGRTRATLNNAHVLDKNGFITVPQIRSLASLEGNNGTPGSLLGAMGSDLPKIMGQLSGNSGDGPFRHSDPSRALAENSQQTVDRFTDRSREIIDSSTPKDARPGGGFGLGVGSTSPTTAQPVTPGQNALALAADMGKASSHADADILLSEARPLLAGQALTRSQRETLTSAYERLLGRVSSGEQHLNTIDDHMSAVKDGRSSHKESTAIMVQANRSLGRDGQLWPPEVRQAVQAWVDDARVGGMWSPQAAVATFHERDLAIFTQANNALDAYYKAPTDANRAALAAAYQEASTYVKSELPLMKPQRGETASNNARFVNDLLPAIDEALNPRKADVPDQESGRQATFVGKPIPGSGDERLETRLVMDPRSGTFEARGVFHTAPDGNGGRYIVGGDPDASTALDTTNRNEAVTRARELLGGEKLAVPASALSRFDPTQRDDAALRARSAIGGNTTRANDPETPDYSRGVLTTSVLSINGGDQFNAATFDPDNTVRPALDAAVTARMAYREKIGTANGVNNLRSRTDVINYIGMMELGLTPNANQKLVADPDYVNYEGAELRVIEGVVNAMERANGGKLPTRFAMTDAFALLRPENESSEKGAIAHVPLVAVNGKYVGMDGSIYNSLEHFRQDNNIAGRALFVPPGGKLAPTANGRVELDASTIAPWKGHPALEAAQTALYAGSTAHSVITLLALYPKFTPILGPIAAATSPVGKAAVAVSGVTAANDIGRMVRTGQRIDNLQGLTHGLNLLNTVFTFAQLPLSAAKFPLMNKLAGAGELATDAGSVATGLPVLVDNWNHLSDGQRATQVAQVAMYATLLGAQARPAVSRYLKAMSAGEPQQAAAPRTEGIPTESPTDSFSVRRRTGESVRIERQPGQPATVSPEGAAARGEPHVFPMDQFPLAGTNSASNLGGTPRPWHHDPDHPSSQYTPEQKAVLDRAFETRKDNTLTPEKWLSKHGIRILQVRATLEGDRDTAGLSVRAIIASSLPPDASGTNAVDYDRLGGSANVAQRVFSKGEQHRLFTNNELLIGMGRDLVRASNDPRTAAQSLADIVVELRKRNPHPNREVKANLGWIEHSLSEIRHQSPENASRRLDAIWSGLAAMAGDDGELVPIPHYFLKNRQLEDISRSSKEAEELEAENFLLLKRTMIIPLMDHFRRKGPLVDSIPDVRPGANSSAPTAQRPQRTLIEYVNGTYGPQLRVDSELLLLGNHLSRKPGHHLAKTELGMQAIQMWNYHTRTGLHSKTETFLAPVYPPERPHWIDKNTLTGRNPYTGFEEDYNLSKTELKEVKELVAREGGSPWLDAIKKEGRKPDEKDYALHSEAIRARAYAGLNVALVMQGKNPWAEANAIFAITREQTPELAQGKTRTHGIIAALFSPIKVPDDVKGLTDQHLQTASIDRLSDLSQKMTNVGKFREVTIAQIPGDRRDALTELKSEDQTRVNKGWEWAKYGLGGLSALLTGGIFYVNYRSGRSKESYPPLTEQYIASLDQQVSQLIRKIDEKGKAYAESKSTLETALNQQKVENLNSIDEYTTFETARDELITELQKLQEIYGIKAHLFSSIRTDGRLNGTFDLRGKVFDLRLDMEKQLGKPDALESINAELKSRRDDWFTVDTPLRTSDDLNNANETLRAISASIADIRREGEATVTQAEGRVLGARREDLQDKLTGLKDDRTALLTSRTQFDQGRTNVRDQYGIEQVAVVQRGGEWAFVAGDAEIRKRMDQVSSADTRLAETSAALETANQQIVLQKASLDTARSVVTQAQTELQRFEGLEKEGAYPEAELAPKRQALAEAQQAVTQIESRITSLEKDENSFGLQISERERELQDAKARLAQLKGPDGPKSLGSAPMSQGEYDTAATKIKNLDEQISGIQEQIKDLRKDPEAESP